MGTPWTDERVRAWIMFVFGVAFATKFAWRSTGTLDPYLVLIVLAFVFGKAVIALWRGKGDG